MSRWLPDDGGRGTPQERLVVAVVIALLGVSGVLVGAAGPTELGASRVPVPDGLGRRALLDVETGERPQAPVLAETEGLPGWVLVVAWTLGLLCVGYLVVRSLRRAEAGAAEPVPTEPAAAGDAGGARLTVLGGLHGAAAAAALELRRASADQVPDVVVRSWERLEEVAAERGSVRPPHVTPTEFTTELLTRHGADPASTGELLRLYHRARFSPASQSPGAAPAAVAAFEAVAASLGPADRTTQSPDPGVRRG